MPIEKIINEKLNTRFAPRFLEVVNESHLHAGHAGSPGTGDSHFRVSMVSDFFSGQSRINRQRMVYDCLKEELAGPIHALALNVKSPEENPDGII